MASSSSPLLVSVGDGNRYGFHSIPRLCDFLGISPPYKKCIAEAPRGRNAPSCSTTPNRENREEVPRLLNDLRNVGIPSDDAGGFLELLSSRVVCGITCRVHQGRAPEIYRKWHDALWDEYLRVNGVEPSPHHVRPFRLAEQTWKDCLKLALRPLDGDPDDSDDSEEYFSDRGEEDIVATPDTTITITIDLDEIQSRPDTRPQASGSVSSSPRPLRPSASPSSPPRSTLNVYRDSNPQTATGARTESTNTRDLGNPLALRPLDRNLPLSRSNTQALLLWSHEVTEANSADLDPTADHTEPEEDDTLHDEESIVIKDRDAPGPRENIQGRSGDDAEEEDTFATDMFALYNIYDDTAVGTEPSSDSSPADTALILPPSFVMYPQVSQRKQLKKFFNLITQTVSYERRSSGYIYAFARPSLPGFLKIGYSEAEVEHSDRDPVDKRFERWRKCGPPIEEIFRIYMPCNAVQRIESLIHQTLREHRRIEACAECKMRHKEWFQVGEQTARRVVGKWRLFSEQLPYNGHGQLAEYWCSKIDGDRRRGWTGDSVMSWIEKIPRMIDEMKKTEIRSITGPLGLLSL